MAHTGGHRARPPLRSPGRLPPRGAGGLLLLSLALGACSRLSAPSDRGSLIFSHAQHVEQAECGDCHGGVEQDRGKVAGKFIPGKSKCGECHEEALKNKCEMCHRGAKEGMRFARPDRKLNFSHAAHLARGAGLSPGPSGGNPVRVRSGARKM